MHPVAQTILQRRAQSVPIHDGNKIGLVLYGGVMGGIRGAGAMLAFEKLGLAKAFDCIYTNSAGFANASYLLADAGQLGTSIYYEDLAGWRFINPFRFWKIVDIDYLISVMRVVKRLPVENIVASKTLVYVALHNVQKHNVAYLEVHSEPIDQYIELMRAATSVPFLHPGSVLIRGQRYMDIPVSQKIHHVEKAFADGCTHVLVIENYRGQCPASWNTDERVFCIQPDAAWKLSRLEGNAKALRSACTQMGEHVCRTFGVAEGITLAYA